MRPKPIYAACLAVLAALLVAACGSSGAKSTSQAAQSNTGASSAVQREPSRYSKPPTTLPVSTPLSRRPPQGKSIYYLNTGIPISQENSAGIQAAAAVLGWKFHSVAVNSGNPATVASGMLSAINGGANVVVVGATSTPVYKSALAVAKAHHTLIIDSSSGNTPVSGVTAYVANGRYTGPEWGKLVALAAVGGAQASGKTLHAVIATSPAFATILGPTDQAIKQNVTGLCPKCSVDMLNIGFGQVVGGQGPAAVVSYLQSHPSTNYVLQDASLIDQGLPQALKGAGLSNVKIVGVGPLAPQIAELKAGTEQAWVDIPLQLEGWMEVDAAARAMVGGAAAAYNHVGEPAYIITTSDPSSPIEAPTNYAAMFKKLWHVG